jgi:hypothetical protein
MKITDERKAKIKKWAANPQVIPPLPVPKFPPFPCQRFNSYAEMNAWKKSMLLKVALSGPSTISAEDQANIDFLQELKRLGKL